MTTQTRRVFVKCGLALAGASLISGCSRLSAPTVRREPWRIGFLSLVPEPYHEALFQALRDLGYVEGRDIVVERRYANGVVNQLPYVATQLVKIPVDLLVVAGVGTSGTTSSQTIPIVIVQPDAVDKGFVSNLARPGGNVTGISISTPALGAKRLEILNETFPSISRVALLEAGGQTDSQAIAMSQAARTLGLQLHRYDVLTEIIRPDFTPRFFQAIADDKNEGLILLDAPYLTANRQQIMAFAAEHHLPAIYPQRAFTDDGGLMSYGANYADLYRRAATYVDKILRGAKAGELPMEQPNTLDFVVNLKTAQALGLTVPQSVLQQTTDAIS